MPILQTTFKNIVVKGQIVHDEQFFLLPQYFTFSVILSRCFKTRLLQTYFCMWERVNRVRHTEVSFHLRTVKIQLSSRVYTFRITLEQRQMSIPVNTYTRSPITPRSLHGSFKGVLLPYVVKLVLAVTYSSSQLVFSSHLKINKNNIFFFIDLY